MNKITRQTGFSLLEVMLIMLISVSLSASGVYGWQRWRQQQQLTQTVWQVRQFLQRARDDANWYNRNHHIWLLQERQGWCLGSAERENEPHRHCDANGYWQLNVPYAEVRVAEITSGLTFYGLRNTATPGHILLRSPAGEWKVIVSNWGRIRACSTQGKQPC